MRHYWTVFLGALISSLIYLPLEAQSLVLKGEVLSEPAPLANERSLYVTVTNGYAFLTTMVGTDVYRSPRKIRVIDVNDPAHPQQTQELNGSGKAILDQVYNYQIFDSKVIVHGSLVLDYSTIYRANFSRDGQPVLTFVKSLAPERILAVDQSHVYVSKGTNAFEIWNFNDPINPIRLGGFTTGYPIYEMKVVDGLAYLALTTAPVLVIVDVTNPAAPWRVGEINTARGQLRVQGNHAYIGQSATTPGGGTIQSVDISNPVVPKLISGIQPVAGLVIGMAVTPTHLFICGLGNGFTIYSLDDPGHPAKIRQINTLSAHDIDIAGNLAYVANGDGGMAIFDLQITNRPVRVGGFATAVDPNGMDVSGGIVALSDEFNGTTIIDARNPQAPVRASTYVPEEGVPEDAMALPHLSGSRLFQAKAGGFDIVDLSVPSNPVRLGSHLRPDLTFVPPPLIATAGNYAFTSAGDVVDIRNPASPQRVSTFSIGPVAPNQWLIDGDFIYYSEYRAFPYVEFLGILDISDPLNVRARGTNGVSGLTISVVYPYLFRRLPGFKPSYGVFDIRDPDQILLTAVREFAGSGVGPHNLDVSGDKLFQTVGTRLILSDASLDFGATEQAGLTIPSALPEGLKAEGNLVFVRFKGMLRVYEGALAPRPETQLLQLEVSRDNGNLVFRWPVTFGDFKLHSAATLTNSWRLVISNPATNGTFLTFTNTRPIGFAQFYTLIK